MNFHYLSMSGHTIYLRQLTVQLNHTGLTPGQPKVLDYLMVHDGVNQKEIADACHIEAAALTSVLNGMETESLIERRRTDGDRHSFYTYLTDNGREMGQEVIEAFSRPEGDTFRGISPERIQEFIELFRRLYSRMQRNFDTGEPTKQTLGRISAEETTIMCHMES